MSDGIDLAVGDMNGDNYADIIVSQLEGGEGIVDGFNGKTNGSFSRRDE